MAKTYNAWPLTRMLVVFGILPTHSLPCYILSGIQRKDDDSDTWNIAIADRREVHRTTAYAIVASCERRLHAGYLQGESYAFSAINARLMARTAEADWQRRYTSDFLPKKGAERTGGVAMTMQRSVEP